MNNTLFTELLESVTEMDDILKGKLEPSRIFEYPALEAKKIREKTGLSQARFALLLGVSKRTLENWEQGRRSPTGPAKVLLRMVDTDPEYALQTLHSY